MTADYMMDDRIIARLRTTEKDRIKLIVDKLDEKYGSASHFVRCAVIKLIREEEDNIRRIERHEGKEGKK